MRAQATLDLVGGAALGPREGIADLSPGRGEISRQDDMPAGPFAIGLTHTESGDEWPYTIICGDGRAIAGQVNSRACAEAIVTALNQRFAA